MSQGQAHRRMCTQLLLPLLVLVIGMNAEANDDAWGPWVDRWPPAGDVEAPAPVSAPRRGLIEAAYRFYRTRISSRDGAVCSFYPTCSGYAILAVRERGIWVGGLLTIDRLLYKDNVWSGSADYPIVTPHGVPRLYDPVPPRRAPREHPRGAGRRRSRESQTQEEPT